MGVGYVITILLKGACFYTYLWVALVFSHAKILSKVSSVQYRMAFLTGVCLSEQNQCISLAPLTYNVEKVWSDKKNKSLWLITVLKGDKVKLAAQR